MQKAKGFLYYIAYHFEDKVGNTIGDLLKYLDEFFNSQQSTLKQTL